jgi:hypothetical protein
MIVPTGPGIAVKQRIGVLFLAPLYPARSGCAPFAPVA